MATTAGRLVGLLTLGLGEVIPLLGKGERVLLIEDGDIYRVEPLS